MEDCLKYQDLLGDIRTKGSVVVPDCCQCFHDSQEGRQKTPEKDVLPPCDRIRISCKLHPDHFCCSGRRPGKKQGTILNFIT